MATSGRHDPYGSFNFLVEIDSLTAATFSECTGLSSEIDVIRYREGGDPRVRLLPGQTTYSRITLKRGITADLSLWQWHKAVSSGQLDRRNGSIVLLDAERKEVARWNFQQGWPAKYEGPSLNAAGNDVAIETVEIVHEGLDRVS